MKFRSPVPKEHPSNTFAIQILKRCDLTETVDRYFLIIATVMNLN